MAFDTTITENDMDFASQSFVQGFTNIQDTEADLSVDGMSESLLSRIMSLFGSGR